MTTGTRNGCAICAMAIAAQIAITTSVISVTENPASPGLRLAGSARLRGCRAARLRGCRAAGRTCGVLRSHVAPGLSSTDADRDAVRRRPAGLAGGEVRQHVAHPMEFARLVEKIIRAERQAPVAVLRKCVVGEYDHLGVRRPTFLSRASSARRAPCPASAAGRARPRPIRRRRSSASASASVSACPTISRLGISASDSARRARMIAESSTITTRSFDSSTRSLLVARSRRASEPDEAIEGSCMFRVDACADRFRGKRSENDIRVAKGDMSVFVRQFAALHGRLAPLCDTIS